MTGTISMEIRFMLKDGYNKEGVSLHTDSLGSIYTALNLYLVQWNENGDTHNIDCCS